MGQYDPTFDLKINVGHCDLYFMVQRFCLIYSKTIWWMIVIFSDNETVWHRDWPHQVYVGQWPIFYGPVILLLIWKTILWRNIVFGIMDQCDTKIDLVKYIWVSDLYFMVHWFCLISCHILELFLYFANWCRLGVFVPPGSCSSLFLIH